MSSISLNPVHHLKAVLNICLLLFTCQWAWAQMPAHEHHDAPVIEVQPRTLNFQPLTIANAPKVELAVEPMEGNEIVYHFLPGWTSQEKATAQTSVLLYIKNKEANTITLQKVRFEYKVNGQNLSKEVSAGNISINPNASKKFQNGREYHKIGDVLYFESGIPTSLTIKLFFSGFATPASMTKNLKPYATAFGLPFKASDLGTDEYWESASTHGGGSQVFAYDMGVEAYVNGKWTNLKSGNGSANSDFRIWGKKIYAMADGVIKGFNNNVPNNPKPGEQADWDDYEHGGAGNHFYIQHGDVIALYAHMQKGTLNSVFMQVGKTVKKGDFLGLAGNSGSSSGPHLHIHIRKETDIESGPFRPLLFNEGFTIGKSKLANPDANINWAELDKKGIPGKEGNRSFIWPSTKHPFCGYSPNAGFISKHGISDANYQAEFNKIYTCGFYPAQVDGYNVGNSTYFNVIFLPDGGKPWVARHNMSGATYQTEFNKWSGEGYRLVNVDCYLRNGAVTYAAVWRKDGGPAVTAYHGVSGAQHQTKFNDLVSKGWVPVNVSTVVVGGNAYITALYEKKSVNGMYHFFGMTMADYQAKFNQYSGQGFKVVYVNAYNANGTARMNAIWYKTAPFGSLVAKHGLTAAQYQTEFNTQTANGYRPFCVSGYDSGGAKFAVIFVK